MPREVSPRLGIGWKVANFLVPGASRWWGANERTAATKTSGAGLLITVRHPPTYDRLRWCVVEWSIVEVTVDGKSAGSFTCSKSGPRWMHCQPGPTTVTVTQLGSENELFCEVVTVIGQGPTRLSITPALGRTLRSARAASIAVRA